MSYPSSAPRLGDTDNVLLAKIAQSLNAGQQAGDSPNDLLRKIAAAASAAGGGADGTFDDLTATTATIDDLTIADGSLLKFGGATSSFPALKNNTSFLEVRTADDSANAVLIAGFTLATQRDASVNTSPVALEAYHATSAGTPTAGNGASIDMSMDSATVARRTGVRLSGEWTIATDATRTARLRFVFLNAGAAATYSTLSPTALDLMGPALQINSVAYFNPRTIYATGSVYTLTATSAAVTFGTISPVITINAAGNYLLRGQIKVALNGATFAANRTLTVKLRRTNNTAVDVADSSITWIVPIVTTITNTLAIINLPETIYLTASATDTIALFADISVLPSAGTISIDAASIVAVRLN